MNTNTRSRVVQPPLVIGTLAERLAAVEKAFPNPEALEKSGDGPATDERAQASSGLVVVESFDPDSDFPDSTERARHIEVLFERALPRLARASNAIIVGFSSGRGGPMRGELRETLSSLGEQLATLGSMQAGIDLTVNAIEVPADHWDALVIERLAEFFQDRRGVLSSGNALPIEELEDLSLKSALVNEFI
ncbi:MAG: hypothetical protein ACTHZ9_08840 [Leucobacter sp.]